MLRVGVDTGYGFTKAVADNGKRVSFPSIMAPAVADPLAGLFKNGVGHRVKISSMAGVEEKLVGEAAMQSQSAQGFVAQQEKPQTMHDLLLLTATYLCLGQQDDGEGISLAVGLPLSYYRMQKDALKKRLETLSAWVSVDGGERRYISFRNVVVFPQGAGALVAAGNALSKNGAVGLIDVGTYTTDFMLFNVRDGMPIAVAEACGSVEAGIHLLHRSLASEFEKQTGVPLPERMYQQTLELIQRGEALTYRGGKISLAPAFERAKREVAETIASQVLATWGDRTGFLSMTFFAGGGAVLFGDLLTERFQPSMVVNDPVFANAAGYMAMLPA